MFITKVERLSKALIMLRYCYDYFIDIHACVREWLLGSAMNLATCLLQQNPAALRAVGIVDAYPY